MDDNGHHENCRQKPDMYKAAQNQWLMNQPSMKQIMSIVAERDAAIQERNMALNEKNKTIEERDLAIRQRDAAIRQRNEAIMERDRALSALDYQYQQNAIDNNNNISCPPGCQVAFGVKHIHHPQQHLVHQPQEVNEPSYIPTHATVVEAAPLTVVATENKKGRKVKQTKEPSKPSKKAKTEGDSNNTGINDTGESDANKQTLKSDWKDEDLGLNQVTFDDTNMPTPVCSCTGIYRHCYKWGNGGWQSACCTTAVSMYPLPPVPNKRHARVGGRKMSGSAFSKLQNRLAAEGHDMSAPVDLKEHWAKHGTNRYITIR